MMLIYFTLRNFTNEWNLLYIYCKLENKTKVLDIIAQ